MGNTRKKPRVLTQCVANTYTDQSERIIEYSNNGAGGRLLGGLMSFENLPDGRFCVQVYSHDPGVEFRIGVPSGVTEDGRTPLTDLVIGHGTGRYRVIEAGGGLALQKLSV